MGAAIRNAWALFLGITLISIAHGLHGSLLSLRAQFEGFATFETATIMSGFYVGFFLGSLLNPISIHRVGHIRTFGAMASLASISVLVYGIWVEPTFWFGLRFLTGFAYAGLYIVSESWLNEAADNKTRGTMLSLYMLLIMGGFAAGQLFLKVWPVEGYELFVVLSVLVSIAVIPILISISPAPSYEAPEGMTVRALYKISPLGVVGMIFIAMSNGIIMGLAPVYAIAIGMTVDQLGRFVMAMMLGAVVLQFPIGWVSDRIDRRVMITLLSFATCTIAIVGLVVETANIHVLTLLVFLLGGINLPLYSMALAHTNDYLHKNQMVAAGGTLVFISGLGMAIGPLSVSFGIDFIGPSFFFIMLGASNCLVGFFALWRISIKESIPLEEQSSYSIVSPTPHAQTVATVVDQDGDVPEWERDGENFD